MLPLFDISPRQTASDPSMRTTAPHVPFQPSSPTSIAAAKSITPDQLSHLESVVYAAFVKAGERGMTDEQCGEATNLDGSTLRPRRVALREYGLIEPWMHHDKAVTRKGRSGRSMQVWKVRAS